MQAFECRALTAGEIALGQSMFGEAIAWKRVRIRQMPPLGFVAMVPLGEAILFSRMQAPRDFSDASEAEQGVFVHELVHVWQAARGTVLALAKLSALGAGAYVYQPRSEARFDDYNIESQAEIVRHLFHARRGRAVTAAPPREWLEAIWTSAKSR